MRETALITGASGGIGLEFAKIFASNRKNLILVARDLGKLVNLKEMLEKRAKIEVTVIDMDLSHPSASYELYNRVKMNNIHVDYLVNNAGVGCYGLFKDTDWQKEEAMLNLNILTLTHLTKLFLNDMLKRNRGRIMNVSSVLGYLPVPYSSVYAATKSYVLAFSQALSYETKGSKVTVTAYCPGATDTGFSKAASMEKSKAFTGRRLPSAESVAKTGYKAMLKGKTVVIHGFMNSMTVLFSRLLPGSILSRIAAMVIKPG